MLKPNTFRVVCLLSLLCYKTLMQSYGPACEVALHRDLWSERGGRSYHMRELGRGQRQSEGEEWTQTRHRREGYIDEAVKHNVNIVRLTEDRLLSVAAPDKTTYNWLYLRSSTCRFCPPEGRWAEMDDLIFQSSNRIVKIQRCPSFFPPVWTLVEQVSSTSCCSLRLCEGGVRRSSSPPPPPPPVHWWMVNPRWRGLNQHRLYQ